MTEILKFSTTKKKQLINITSAVEDVVEKMGLRDGICLVFVPHATAALLLNEDEPGFKADVERLLSSWIPEGAWQHNQVDNNATAHLAASLIGQARTIPVSDGSLQLGTWQEVFLVELDGPRTNRKVIVSITGTK